MEQDESFYPDRNKSGYTDKINNLFNEYNNKYSTKSMELLTKDKFSERGRYPGEMNCKLKTIDGLNENKILKDKIISIDTRFSRVGKLKNAEKLYTDEIVKQKEKKKKKIISVSQNKNERILNEINYLFDVLDNIKTTSDHSLPVPDSLLNTHKNFILFKKYDQFEKGISLLDLKRQEFLEKANLLIQVKLLYKYIL
jgi:hypothetical protein